MAIDAKTELFFLVRTEVCVYADNWIMDGTFKSSPVQFTQLYTIHGLSAGRNVVGSYIVAGEDDHHVR